MQIISCLKLQVNDMSISEQEQDTARRDSATHKSEIIDTQSVSERSHISDITFYDSANIITRIKRDQINGFPLKFIEKNRKRED